MDQALIRKRHVSILKVKHRDDRIIIVLRGTGELVILLDGYDWVKWQLESGFANIVIRNTVNSYKNNK